MTLSKVLINPVPLIKHVSGKRIMQRADSRFKLYRRLWVQRPLKFEAGKFPLFLDIEVTDACNLRCSFCATTHMRKSSKRRFIDSELVYRILKEGKRNGLYGVKFNDRGEPLLHPELFNFIRQAKDYGFIDIYFNTNGQLLDEKKAIQAVTSGLNRISFSIEGFTPEFYEKYRVGGKFSSVLENIQRLNKVRKALKSRTPLIRIQTVLLPETEKINGYLRKFKMFWGKYADEISAIEYKEESGSVKCVPGSYRWACHQLWQRMVVLCDGRILPCNEDWSGKLSLGNVRFMRIKSAWNSFRLEKIRRTHMLGGAGRINACSGCYLRSSQMEKERLNE